MMRNETRSGNAFSLIELLVVTAITGIAISAVIAAFAAGLNVWEFVRVTGSSDGSVALASLELERDLKNAVSFGDHVPFDGSAHALTFAAHRYPSRRSNIADGAVRKISYHHDTQGGVIIKRETPFPDRDAQRTHTEIIIAEGVKQLVFKYDDPASGSWQSVWQSATNLPRRVGFTMVCTSRLDRVETRQVVLLPTSGIPQE